MIDNKQNLPWIEKYRPIHFEDIVLDQNNKIILLNIIKKQTIPHLLFYGPPGTGKTTTAINFIERFQKYYNNNHKELMIHLNASDERGIDIIRNQINNFVNSKPLFNKGYKFVILDEVDYMTKTAQQALKYLINSLTVNKVCFCLICNYISKIDETLQNEFVKLRFNQLPKNEIFNYLNNIVFYEKININEEQINHLIQLFKSDIRSMINFIQTNFTNKDNHIQIIKENTWKDFTNFIMKKNNNNKIKNYFDNVCNTYNIDYRICLNNICNYIIKNYKVNKEILNIIEIIIHNNEANNIVYVNYFCDNISLLLK